jgi:hypothetical protein
MLSAGARWTQFHGIICYQGIHVPCRRHLPVTLTANKCMQEVRTLHLLIAAGCHNYPQESSSTS